MKAGDAERFAVAWQSAHQVYGKGVEPAAIALVFRVLQGYELADVEAALGRHLKTSEFAPKPADIVRAIEGSEDSQVALAWQRFREATRSGNMPSDEALCKVIRRMGGLELLGDRTSRDLDFMRDNFKALWLAERDPVRLGIAAARREAIGRAA